MRYLIVYIPDLCLLSYFGINGDFIVWYKNVLPPPPPKKKKYQKHAILCKMFLHFCKAVVVYITINGQYCTPCGGMGLGKNGQECAIHINSKTAKVI